MLDPEVSPETEDLSTDDILETIDEGQGEDHRRHADRGGTNGQPDDRPGEGALTVPGKSAGNEEGSVQGARFWMRRYLFVMICKGSSSTLYHVSGVFAKFAQNLPCSFGSH